eukprot:TRINITY_DN22757_c0_g1_i1.p1 TRINITY_DN22757_c0_g1~~TRINITY_DN22757_c0_g1_i1.p1  ORF type:complete len:330 (+),score=24.38 TRINITY_DN22757_c0_g1_i1:26-1015(+)
MIPPHRDTSFHSYGECFNQTKGCYGNGLCVAPPGRNWTCSCKFFFYPQTNCGTTVRGLWNGKDTPFWVCGLIVSTILLLLFLIECFFQFKHKKLLRNEMTLMRFILIAALSFRVVDYSLWGYLSTSKVYCFSCEQVQLVLSYVPYYLGVLSLKICVVVWFNLMLSIENLSFNHFKTGRNVYIVISTVFAAVGLVLMLGCAIFSYTAFRPVVNYTITIPLLGTVIHCYVQVYKIFKKLKGAKAPKAIEAYRKNSILGWLSSAWSVIIVLVVTIDIAFFRKDLSDSNYWTWLILFSILRFFEYLAFLLYFLFSQQYTLSILVRNRPLPLPV